MDIWDQLITRKLDRGVVPFYIIKEELNNVLLILDVNDWYCARELANETLAKYGDDKAVYRATIEEGGYVRGEFERRLKVDVVDVRKRMASHHLNTNQ